MAVGESGGGTFGPLRLLQYGYKKILPEHEFCRIVPPRKDFSLLPVWTPSLLLVRTSMVSSHSNSDKRSKLEKARHSRWLGRGPIVRGAAMNRTDHPQCGGKKKKESSCGEFL